jgi:hypothetical protein
MCSLARSSFIQTPLKSGWQVMGPKYASSLGALGYFQGLTEVFKGLLELLRLV